MRALVKYIVFGPRASHRQPVNGANLIPIRLLFESVGRLGYGQVDLQHPHLEAEQVAVVEVHERRRGDGQRNLLAVVIGNAVLKQIQLWHYYYY